MRAYLLHCPRSSFQRICSTCKAPRSSHTKSRMHWPRRVGTTSQDGRVGGPQSSSRRSQSAISRIRPSASCMSDCPRPLVMRRVVLRLFNCVCPIHSSRVVSPPSSVRQPSYSSISQSSAWSATSRVQGPSMEGQLCASRRVVWRGQCEYSANLGSRPFSPSTIRTILVSTSAPLPLLSPTRSKLTIQLLWTFQPSCRSVSSNRSATRVYS